MGTTDGQIDQHSPNGFRKSCTSVLGFFVFCHDANITHIGFLLNYIFGTASLIIKQHLANYTAAREMDFCSEYANIKASEIVKTALDNVQDTLLQREQEEKDKNSSKEICPNDYERKNIDWISCKEFTIDLGKEQIEKYISMWELDPTWLHSLVFLEEKELEFHRQYHYRVLWSIPTRQTPIPKATAKVYFIIEISKIKPQSLPVEVYFVVESCRLRHRPGKTTFRQKWLQDVIDCKTLLRTTINF